MVGFGTSSGGKSPNVVATCVVALYDPATGNIVHAHAITTMEGAVPRDEQSAIEEAKSLAQRAGHSVDKLAIRTSTNIEHALKPHRIDLVTGQFIAASYPVRAK